MTEGPELYEQQHSRLESKGGVNLELSRQQVTKMFIFINKSNIYIGS